ncbi:hypothetical protein [Mycolicibacterium sphagni]|uniref:hypothetical protein n=1 Tax=Mycolicibacterium sphagni TaxID=1786 RepID=UPI0021F30EFC|nr:hypothetical protein [Mycolicibacterium sphagni]MCV7174800.1 hypothetical protein [Mycolicibacterium sphagni]
MTAVRIAALPILGLLIAGCSSEYTAPTTFTISESAVTQTVSDVLNHTGSSAKPTGTPDAICTDDGGKCTISYTVAEVTGIDNDIELIQPTRQIWKTLFEDPRFQGGIITVSGPATTVGGKSDTSTYFTLACDRDAAGQIDWDHVDGKGLRTLCDYNAKISGMG